MKDKRFEKFVELMLKVCAMISIGAVVVITIYMIIKGVPAIGRVGLSNLLFSTLWRPTANNPSFGIGFIILSSLVTTTLAVIIGVPIGLLTAVYLSEMASKKMGKAVGKSIEILAAVPSVIYGLVGMMILNPIIYKLEVRLFTNNTSHIFTGGSNLLAAVIVLVVMILPTVISVSASSLKSVNPSLKAASLSLGATKQQTIVKMVIPAAKSGIMTGAVLGVGRALGEAMAISMVAGGSVNLPLPFNSITTLTTQIVSEMGYAEGLHREVLFTVGLVLYLFIMIVNYVLLRIKRGDVANAGR